MIKIFLLVFLIVFISSGYGLMIKKSLHLEKVNFILPFGFAAYLFTLQLFYYPIQFFSLDSIYLMVISTIISSILLIFSIANIKEIIEEYKNTDFLWVLIGSILFIYVFYQLSVSMELSDSQVYLNFIAQNINADKLNYFDFWTGKIGEPNEPFYLYQGFYHFGSFLCWVINIPYYLFNSGFVENIATSVWGLGIIYSIVSNAFFVDIVNELNLDDNKLLKHSLLAFLVLFFNFYYWRVGYAFYGNTYRTLFVGMLLFLFYKKYQNNQDVNILWFSIVIGAGLASSSSSLFIMFDMVYVLMAYLYLKKEERPFKKLSIIVFPIVLFALGFISYYSIKISLVLSVIVVLYYIFMDNTYLCKLINYIDLFLFKYGKFIFLIIVPLFLVFYSYYLNLDEWYLSSYAHYFENHADYDMVIDPFGRFGNIYETFVCFVRFAGIIALIKLNSKDKNYFISFFLICTFLVFLNPLTTSAIAKLYADFVYYRAFDILINPFTEVIYFYAIYKVLGNRKSISITMSLFIIIGCLLMHSSQIVENSSYSSYAHLKKEGKNVNGIFKLTDNELLVLRELRSTELIPNNEQIAILSHAEGVKTFFPNAYQIFARRQYFDASKRVNEEFYQIAKRHYGWLEEEIEIDYSKTCGYIEEYDVKVAIVNYKENWDFDQATDACMLTMKTIGDYKIKYVE